jgi:hypothetical protein
MVSDTRSQPPPLVTAPNISSAFTMLGARKNTQANVTKLNVITRASQFGMVRNTLQQSSKRVAIAVLDAHLLKPAGLHDAGDAGRIVAITLINLHLEYSLGVARVDTDHRQAKLFELGSTAMWPSVRSQGRSVSLLVPSISRMRRSPQARNRLRPLARLIPPGSPHRSMSASTTRPVRHNVPSQLSIVARAT